MNGKFTRMAVRYANEVTKTGFDNSRGLHRPCGKLEIDACYRFLNDLSWQSDDDFDFQYFAPAAEEACEFIEMMPHTKGKWAVRTKDNDGLIDLEPWQAFIICNIFGWFDKSSGERRFTESYIEVARKNGKTILMAAIAMYFAVADGEYAPEVFLGATSVRQAKIAFNMARSMAKKLEAYDGFCSEFGIGVFVEKIDLPDQGIIEPLPANPGDGASPSFSGIDEYHEHKHDKLVGAMETGMGARDNPHMMKITTAGNNYAGPCWTQRKRMVDVLRGAIKAERIFTVIFGPDPEDDWHDFDNWKKSNPNYGVSVKESFLRGRLAKAEQSPKDRNIILTKNFNVWRHALESYFDIPAWVKCGGLDDVSEEELLNARCSMAMDLAYKRDLVAVSSIFELERDSGKVYYIRSKFFVPEETAELPENMHYQTYAENGEIEITPGQITDFDRVEEYVVARCKTYQVETVYYDTYGAVQLATNLAGRDDIEIDVCEFLQRAKYTTEPMRWLEALIKAGQVRHDGGQCMTWCLGNVVAKDFADKGVLPRKENNEKKIDGAVTAIMAIGHFFTHDEDEMNYFESNNLVMIGG